MASSVFAADRPILIAHRGASGYLPEHTLAAKALAYGMGADFIEQDVVLTRDDVPIILHDVHLDTVTDVAERFPDRARDDGRFYAIDFSLAEVKQLRVGERIDRIKGIAVYPSRFPADVRLFDVPTLQEEVELLQGLNRSTSRNVGLYLEIKSPAWHREQRKDISPIVLELLGRAGYRDHDDNIFLQCFDAAETRRIRTELGSKLRLVQLIGKNSWGESSTDYDRLRTEAGLREVAEYADGIGPSIDQVLLGVDKAGHPQFSDLVGLAHRHGLVVHPYTLRVDQLPEGAADFATAFGWLLDAGIDGVFTDFPDQAVRVVESLQNKTAETPRH